MARQRVGEFLKLAFLPSLARTRAASPERGEKIERWLGELLDVVDAYDNALEAADSNPDLSPRGRTKAKEAAVREAWTKLDGKAAHAEKMDLYKQQVEKELGVHVTPKRPSDPGERIAFELRQREIRDSLRGLSQLERTAVYQETADAEVRDALENAPAVAVLTPSQGGLPAIPRFEPFVAPDVVTESRIRRANEAAPSVAQELSEVVGQQQLYRDAVAQARQAIRREHPTAGGDPLQAVIAAAK